MFTISKNQQPGELLRYKKTADASYANMDGRVKAKIRLQLLREQGYLCAYCMGRIRDDQLHTKIEHVEPQKNSPEKALEYSNMLAVCNGGKGQPLKQQHCDTYKGDKLLSFNPSNINVNLEKKLNYSGSGEIFSDDVQLSADLNNVLNLNVASLVQNRCAVFVAVKGKLSTFKKHANKADISKLIDKWEALNLEGKHNPYFAVAVYFLNKRLQKCTS